MALRETVDTLNQMILNGEILDAFEKYYHQDVVMSDNRDGRRIAASKNVPEGSCRCLNQLFLRMSALVGLSSVVPQFEIEQPSTLGRNGAC